MEEPAVTNAYVAYFDVLGFTSRFLSGDLKNRYEKLVASIDERRDKNTIYFLFSDSIVVISKSFARVRETARSIYTWGVLNDLWLRGGIAHGGLANLDFGTFVTDNRVILPFLGEGYLKAYKLESTLNISGIALDDIFFEPGKECAALKREADYVEYEEYLPKRGYEDRKLLLLPEEGSLRQIVDTMYFEEMLKSHINDIDKYINTFIFFHRNAPEDGKSRYRRQVPEQPAQGTRTSRQPCPDTKQGDNYLRGCYRRPHQTFQIRHV